jgi:hypothetical protein
MATTYNDETLRQVKSCGFLVMKSDRRFLLMKHKDRLDLPKGHMKTGECEQATALRGNSIDARCRLGFFLLQRYTSNSIVQAKLTSQRMTSLKNLSTRSTDVENNIRQMSNETRTKECSNARHHCYYVLELCEETGITPFDIDIDPQFRFEHVNNCSHMFCN